MILTAALSAVNLLEAEPSWQCRVWRVDDGLIDNRVMGVKQSSDGLLWVATASGVMRFDGLEFRSFPLSLNGVLDGRIYAFFIDSRDRLWIVGSKSEILCLGHGSGEMKLALPSKPCRSGPPSIVEEQDGRLIFCFPDGTLFRVCDGKIEPFILDKCFGRDPARQVVKDGLGQIWLSLGDQGFGMITDGKFCLQEELPVSCLTGARSGGVWICSGRDLWLYSEESLLEGVTSLPEELHDISQNVFVEDKNGALWLGDNNGISLFRFDGGSFSVACSVDSRITSLDQDSDGNMWVGTGDGLKQLTPAGVRFLACGKDICMQKVISMAEDTAGYYWIVWNSRKISRFSSQELFKDDRIPSRSLFDVNPIPLVGCAVADPAGGLWLGTEFNGVYLWKDGVVITNLGREYGFEKLDVNALQVTQDGALWIGAEDPALSQSFLRCWKAGRFQDYPLSVESSTISAITSDSSGNTWCSTRRGYLFRIGFDGAITNVPIAFSQVRCPILSLCHSPDNSLWIVFSGQGLGRLKEGRFTHYMTDQGLHDDSISRVLFDGTNRLWFVGNKGLFSVLLKDFDDLDAGYCSQVQSIAYGKREGLPNPGSTGYYWPGAIRDKAGRLLFCMQRGIAVVNPVNADDVQRPPPVFIDRVRVDGVTIAYYWVDLFFAKLDEQRTVGLRQEEKMKLRIPPGASHLEFTFTALSYKLPESTVFKCRLQGLSDEWSDIGSLRKISYYGLRPGDYQFQVMARNSDGLWNETDASLELTLEPYWWQTAWFRVATPLAAVGLVLCGIIIVLRRRQKFQIERLELLQATEKERARIAADLHDDLGAGLTEIGLTGDLALDPELSADLTRQYLTEIVDKTGEMAESLDEIVWAANPANDRVSSLVEYSLRFFERIVGKTSKRMHLAVDRVLPEVSLKPGSRHQLFLAFREAVTNMIRHSGADEVYLTIEVRDDKLVMVIQDNGCGMDLDAQNHDGNGLRNMKCRLQQIGGLSQIITAPGKGTTIRFEVGLKI
jgi:signal transduction histidine kinase